MAAKVYNVDMKIKNKTYSETESTFPNPLLIQMGEGRLLFSRYTTKNKTDAGIIISDTGEAHEIGSVADSPLESDYTAKEGEIWIQFGKKESAECFRDIINEIIEEWPKN